MMKTLFVLMEENEDTSTVVGVTDSKEWAHAFGMIDQFNGLDQNALEIVTLNVLDGKLLARIEEWLDPVRNPLCTCRHRKLHHRLRNGKPGVGACKHNRAHGGKEFRHMCKSFVMAKDQPRINFGDRPAHDLVAE